VIIGWEGCLAPFDWVMTSLWGITARGRERGLSEDFDTGFQGHMHAQQFRYSPCNVPITVVRFVTNVRMCRQIFVQIPHIKFKLNAFRCGQIGWETNMAKLTGAFFAASLRTSLKCVCVASPATSPCSEIYSIRTVYK
jgi:hypothetical protein